MNEKPVFNEAQLIDSAADDAELAQQVVALFLSDTPKLLGSLEEALNNGDAKTAERLAHSLKGSAATIGGQALGETMGICEALGREGKLDELKTRLPDLYEQYRKLCQELANAGYSQA